MAYIRQRGKSWCVETYVNGVRGSKTLKTQALAQAWAERAEARAEGMPQLRALLSDHRIVPLLPRRFKVAMDRANYTEAEILNCAFPIDLDSGIYFLIRAGEVSYVGKTTCVLRRVQKHRTEGRKFDSFSFIPCLPEQLDELEKTYICLLMPEENQKIC